ncbi:hypothetical protein D3C87_1390070 [compost metagenome]
MLDPISERYMCSGAMSRPFKIKSMRLARVPPAFVIAVWPVVKFAISVVVKGRRHNLRPNVDRTESKQVVLAPLIQEETVEF